VNAKTEALFGHPRSHLVGQPLEVVIGGRDPDRVGRRRDGSEFPVEVSLNSVRLARRTLVIASVRDASARLEAMRVLRETEERFRLAFEDAPHGMALMT